MISDFNFSCVIETWYKTCVLWVVHQAKQTKNSGKFSKQVFSIFAAYNHYNLKRGELLSLNKQNICTQNTLGFQINNSVCLLT